MTDIIPFKVSNPALQRNIEVSLGKDRFYYRSIFLHFIHSPFEKEKGKIEDEKWESICDIINEIRDFWPSWCSFPFTEEQAQLNLYDPEFYHNRIECFGYHSWDAANDLCKFFEDNGLKCQKIQYLTKYDYNQIPYNALRYGRGLYEVKYFRPLSSPPSDEDILLA